VKTLGPISAILILASLGALVAVSGHATVAGTPGRAGESQNRSALAASAEFAFAQTYVDEDYGGNGKPGFSLAADMDGDDDIDIVAGGGGALFVYENDGAAGGWTHHGSLDATGDIGANGAVLYDVDSDGHTDVVAALYTDDLGWWENPGGALSSASWTFHPLDSAISGWFSHDAIRGDLDDDGKAEEFIFALQRGYWNAPYHITWYRPGTDPTDAWEKHTITYNHAGANNNHAGIDLADLDADGDVDVIFSNGWFESPGDPTGTWTWHEVSTIYGISNAQARDMDGDDDLDLVVSGGHHGQGVFWFENAGDPHQTGNWTQHNISAVKGDEDARCTYDGSADYLHHPEGLQVVDLDQDGDMDVIVAELFFGEDPGEPAWSDEEHNLYVYESSGGGSPSFTKHNIAPHSYASHQLQIVDVNQDGLLDIVSEGCGYKIVSYYENDGGTTPPLSSCFELQIIDNSYNGNGRPGWSRIGDIDGDGAGDVAAGGGNVLNWYESPSWARTAVGEAGANGGALFDVDDDGDLDMVSSVYLENHRTYWYENPADPTSPNWTRRVIDNSSDLTFQHDLEVGDIDMDGEQDDFVVLHDNHLTGEGILKWYHIPANPKADPWGITTIAHSTVGGVGLAIGDINGDDRSDVVRGGTWYQAPNPATGTWIEHTATTQHLTNVRLADLDRDGDLDIAGADGWSDSGPLLWLENEGNGASWQSYTVDTLYHPESLVVMDVDQDGSLELITGEMRGATDSTFLIFENDGGWARHVVDDTHGICARMNTGDLDGDGDLDIACDGNSQNHIYVWVNAGCNAESESSYKAASTTAPRHGEAVDFTIVIRNLAAPLSHTVVLTDTVPAGLGYVPGTLTATAGTTDAALAPTLTWTGSLSPSGVVTVGYAVTITAATPTVITNTCTIDVAPYGTITGTARVLANWSTAHVPLVMRTY